MIKKTCIRVFDKGFRGVSVENHIIYFKIFNYKEKTNLPMNNTVDILQFCLLVLFNTKKYLKVHSTNIYLPSIKRLSKIDDQRPTVSITITRG